MKGENISHRICPRCRSWKGRELKRSLLISKIGKSVFGTCYTIACGYWFGRFENAKG